MVAIIKGQLLVQRALESQTEMAGAVAPVIECLQRAVELKPGCAHAHYWLARAHMACGREQAALDAFGRYVDNAPDQRATLAGDEYSRR